MGIELDAEVEMTVVGTPWPPQRCGVVFCVMEQSRTSSLRFLLCMLDETKPRLKGNEDAGHEGVL